MTAAWMRKDRAAQPEKHRERARLWRLNNKEKVAAAKKREYLRKTYDISAAERDAVLVAQGGCCAICKRKSSGWKRDWHTDHNHDTGKVRGLLCWRCNTGLGKFHDDPGLLEAALRYLVETP